MLTAIDDYAATRASDRSHATILIIWSESDSRPSAFIFARASAFVFVDNIMLTRKVGGVAKIVSSGFCKVICQRTSTDGAND